MRLDDLDRSIIACLVEDGRASYSSIGDRVGLSAAAVNRRVERLRRDGVIRGFTAVINPDAVGEGTEAFVELHARSKTSPGDLRRIAAALEDVVAAYTITGDADALVHIRTADIVGLENTLERLRADPRIERTSSVIVLSTLLDRAVPTQPARGRGTRLA
jgi:DNA-binding Lrp family transcriptional regulator